MPKKIDRNKANVVKIEEAKKKNLEGVEFAKHREMIMAKKDFIKNQFNGYYHLERANSLATQHEGKIIEKIDGALKSKGLVYAEYLLMKMFAIEDFRNAYHAKKELMEKHGFSKEDIIKIEEDFTKGAILREEYEEGMAQTRKAQFVQS